MRNPILSAVLALSTLVIPSAAHAGNCSDPWINKAWHDINKAFNPNGWGDRGECNIRLYGNGSWSSFEDLKSKVQTYKNSLTVLPAGQCRDPFITQAFQKALGRVPYGVAENGECDMYMYGGGSWSSLDDLVAKVKGLKGVSSAPPAPSLAGLHLSPSGDVLNGQGSIVARSAEVAASLVGNSGGTLITNDGGTLLSENGLGLVAQGGGNIAANYGLKSTSSGKTILGTCTLRDGRKVAVFKK